MMMQFSLECRTIYMLFAGCEVRIVKKSMTDRDLESPRSQFSLNGPTQSLHIAIFFLR